MKQGNQDNVWLQRVATFFIFLFCFFMFIKFLFF